MLGLRCAAALPPPPKDAELADFPIHYTPDAPGPFDASFLLDKPAGSRGPVVARDGHFFIGDGAQAKRIRFWGVNVCYSACFPTHEQADRVAGRLARFGINAVRFHHMDSAPWPRGIFADRTLEKLSPEALDRLDYFVAALKKQGIYSNLNLHVSRTWSKAHGWENADKLPESFDKLIDIFHPDLIAANRQYARDLLTHVNKYTGKSYAAEPAVCMVEINNEDTLFLWGGQRSLARLPEPYARMLKRRWNQWLREKYADREALAAAWSVGAEPRGQDLLRDTPLATLNRVGSAWSLERHGGAEMNVALDANDRHFPLAKIVVTKVTGTAWHLQFNQAGVALRKGRHYTLSFRARAQPGDGPKEFTVSLAQAHEPWRNLGLSKTLKLYPQNADYHVGFVAAADEANARVSFAIGGEAGTLWIGNVSLQPGGQQGLDPLNEDPAQDTVYTYGPDSSWSKSRLTDWYDFLQQTDEAYFVDMRDFLKKDLKVAAPVTGTIGLGPLGTLSQSKMDFVDAHAYWDHPRFPNNDWNPRNWTITNRPMVDDPEGATLWKLAATRVAGKPFTVTEYNHAAPNEWQAECIPMIATYAAIQDWDGVFLFAYSHNDQFEKERVGSFFDIEGNPAKMMAMPVGARIFMSGSVPPSANNFPIRISADHGYIYLPQFYSDVWAYAHMRGAAWTDILGRRIELVPSLEKWSSSVSDPRIEWKPVINTAGRFTLWDPSAAVFVGSATGKFPVNLVPVAVRQLETPFAVLMLAPADPAKTLREADRLLLFAAGRVYNGGMAWDQKRTTVSDKWGKGPPRIEVVRATLSLPHDYTVRALDSAGRVIKEFATADKTLTLGAAPTVWYELVRRK